MESLKTMALVLNFVIEIGLPLIIHMKKKMKKNSGFAFKKSAYNSTCE